MKVAIPRPDPQNLWILREGQDRMISVRPFLQLTLISILGEHEVMVRVDYDPEVGSTTCPMRLDRSCPLLESARGIPLVIAVLRRIDGKDAYFQITAEKNLRQVRRMEVLPVN